MPADFALGDTAAHARLLLKSASVGNAPQYDAPALTDRIKQRPYLFTIGVTSALLLFGSVATFILGVGYFSQSNQILFITGGILIQGPTGFAVGAPSNATTKG